MMRRQDGTIVLAQSALGTITMCPSGVVSLQLGAVTIRLDGTALLGVEHMIEDALDSLCEIVAEKDANLPLTRAVQ